MKPDFTVKFFSLITLIIVLTSLAFLYIRVQPGYTGDLPHYTRSSVGVYPTVYEVGSQPQLVEKFTEMGVSAVWSDELDLDEALRYDITAIEVDWLCTHYSTLVEELIFSGRLVVFYGPRVNRIFDVIDTELLKSRLAILVSHLNQTEPTLSLPDDVIAYGIIAYVIRDSGRAPCGHYVLESDFFDPVVVAEYMLVWWNEVEETLAMIRSAEDSAQHGTSLNPAMPSVVGEVFPEGWDHYVGDVGWFKVDIKIWGTVVATLQYHVDYWYKADPDHPNYHWFLTHVEHATEPKYANVGPYNSWTKVDLDTDNHPDQEIFDWGPKNWGGPKETITFGVSVGPPGVYATVEYSISEGGIHWRDKSSPADGLHYVLHKFREHGHAPFGVTATVEPTNTFLEDVYVGGFPVVQHHWAKSKVQRMFHAPQYGSGTISFTVYIWPTYVETGD